MTLSLNELHAAFLRLLTPAQTEPLPPAATDALLPGPEGAVPAVAPAVPASPCQMVDPKSKGYHLDVKVSPQQVVAAAELLDVYGFAMDAVTGVDWLAAGEMEVVYDFYHMTTAMHAVVRTRVPRANPELPTISSVFPGANWHERETHEFFGIRFIGHPDLTPLLLPEDATYHPLRKDFTGAT
jgi:NADH-quinone oxidoreductase subunit C